MQRPDRLNFTNAFICCKLPNCYTKEPEGGEVLLCILQNPFEHQRQAFHDSDPFSVPCSHTLTSVKHAARQFQTH